MARKVVAVGGIVAAMLAFGMGSATAATLTASVGETATLTNRVAVTVPVEITCSPDSGQSEGSFLEVEQAVGKGIAHASGYIIDQVVCDDTLHQYSVWALADSGGYPFKKGKAVVRLFVGFCNWDVYPNECTRAYVGPQSITLR